MTMIEMEHGAFMERVRMLNAKIKAAQDAGYTVHMGKVYTSTKPTDGPSRYVCDLQDFNREEGWQ